MEYIEVGIEILNKIEQNGFKAYIVGGFVRDYLLKDKVNDIDIATSAMPKDIKKIFNKVVPTGIKYESVTVIYKSFSFEITTFRKDISYYDNRHPICEYTSSLKEDLARRDFTINAMAMDKDFNIIDFNCGKKDLGKKMLVAVGNPKKRFSEDALRILRGFYFSSKLGFDIEKNTLDGMNDNSYLLDKISGNRIYRELKKMFKQEYLIKGLTYLSDSKALNYLPSLSKGTKIIVKSKNKVSFIEFLSLSFYLEGFSNRYPITRVEKKQITSIIALIDSDFTNYILFSNSLNDLLISNDIKKMLGYKSYDNIKTKKNNLVLADENEFTISQKDLVDLGYKKNEIKEKYKELLILVLNNKEKNNKEMLLRRCKIKK